MCHSSPGVQPGDLFDGLEADYDIHLYSICMGILFQTSNMGTLILFWNSRQILDFQDHPPKTTLKINLDIYQQCFKGGEVDLKGVWIETFHSLGFFNFFLQKPI